MGYEYLEDVAWADVAFQAWGASLEETFAAAAEATVNVMIDDPASLRSVTIRDVSLESDTLEMLLHEFLEEIVFYKDAEGLLLRPCRISLDDDGRTHVLKARLAGEEIDPARHETGVDVKAVTFYRFALERTASGFQATVVLDV